MDQKSSTVEISLGLDRIFFKMQARNAKVDLQLVIIRYLPMA
jgi:hypothetical protein